MATEIKGPFQAYFDMSEEDLAKCCIVTGEIDHADIDTETVDATMDDTGISYTNIPAIIHTDYGCRARKIAGSVETDFFERATTIISFKEDVIYHEWDSSTHDWKATDIYAPRPKATFVAIRNEGEDDDIIAYIQPQVFFAEAEFQDSFSDLAPPSTRMFYMIKVWEGPFYAKKYTYSLCDVHTGAVAMIPNSDFTEMIPASRMSIYELEYYLENSRSVDIEIIPTVSSGYQQVNVMSQYFDSQWNTVVHGSCKTIDGSVVTNGWLPYQGASASAQCYDGEFDSSYPEYTIYVNKGFYQAGPEQTGSIYLLYGFPGEKEYDWKTYTDYVYTDMEAEGSTGIGDDTASATLNVMGTSIEFTGSTDTSTPQTAYRRTFLWSFYGLFFTHDGLIYGNSVDSSIFLAFGCVYIHDGSYDPVPYKYEWFAQCVVKSQGLSTPESHLIGLGNAIEDLAMDMASELPSTTGEAYFTIQNIWMVFAAYNIEENDL